MSASTYADRIAGVAEELGAAISALAGFFPANLPVAATLQEAMQGVVALCESNSADLNCSVEELEIAIEVAADYGADLVGFQGVNYLNAAEASAIALYTMNGPFFHILNLKLRDRDREKLKSFIGIINARSEQMSSMRSNTNISRRQTEFVGFVP